MIRKQSKTRLLFIAIIVSALLVSIFFYLYPLPPQFCQQFMRVAELTEPNEMAEDLDPFHKTVRRYRRVSEHSWPKEIAEDLDTFYKPYLQTFNMVPVPYTTMHYQPNVRGKSCNTNDLGFRGVTNYQEMIKLANSLHRKGWKIAVFTGGSAAFGDFSDTDESSIVGYMNEYAKVAGIKLHIFNFGMGNFISDQELVLSVIYASSLEPDLLIVMDGYNDAIRLVKPVAYNLGSGLPYGYPQIRDSYNFKFTSEFLDRIYDNRRTDTKVKELPLAEVLKRYRKNILDMCYFMNGKNKEIIIGTQPVRGYRNNYTSLYDPGNQGDIERLLTIYDKFEECARRAANKGGALYVDLAGVFEGIDESDNVFVDNCHMTSKGQSAVAKKLFESLYGLFSEKK